MMDGLTLSGIIVFIGCGFALWITRKTGPQWLRYILAVSMFLNLAAVVVRVERDKERVEVVWHEKAINWGHMPLAVWWDRSKYTDYNDTFEAAIALWNTRVGCTVLYPAQVPGDASITIKSADGTRCGSQISPAVGLDENPNAPVSGWYCTNSFDIQTKRLDEVGLAFRIILHELGHGIGLAHDKEGAMAPQAMEPKIGDAPEYLLPNNKDVFTIKARYCP
jgi:hypothetical protein